MDTIITGDAPPPEPLSSLTLNLSNLSPDSPAFGPRTGNLILHRHDGSAPLSIKTPAFVAATTRGVIPHLSRDHVRITKVIRWVHVPFESFLEHMPPVPTLQPGPQPLHKFLGYVPSQHALCMSLRDPFDGRDMPPNSHNSISAYCIRGVRQVTPQSWSEYVSACSPDAVGALSDTPFTTPPHSQKRLTKCIERSILWLTNMLKSQLSARILPPPSTDVPNLSIGSNVFVHMAGGASVQARRAFADSLIEKLASKDREQLKPLDTLDDGISAYTFDLVPIRVALSARSGVPQGQARGAINTVSPTPHNHPDDTSGLSDLLQASLSPLPPTKPRIVNSAKSPHEMLRLMRDVGIDLFDAHWAQRAADIGVALDFRFPVSYGLHQSQDHAGSECPQPQTRHSGKLDLGHNLYNARYAHDHSRLASHFLDSASYQRQGDAASTFLPVCPCAACSPRTPTTHLHHSSLDALSFPTESNPSEPADFLEPFKRSYLHHLLHTHEMSAHSLLVMHNLSVLDAFFCGVQELLADTTGVDVFSSEVEKFMSMYDEDMIVFDEAKMYWAEVERARGKGRLAREKVKQSESSLGTSVEL